MEPGTTYPDLPAAVHPISDRQYAGFLAEELLALVPEEDIDYDGPSVFDAIEDDADVTPRLSDGLIEGVFSYREGGRMKLGTHVYLVDSLTLSHPERPLLAINLFLDHGQQFRLAAESAALVDVNLSIGNLGFNDFIDTADTQPDSIFRGF